MPPPTSAGRPPTTCPSCRKGRGGPATKAAPPSSVSRVPLRSKSKQKAAPPAPPAAAAAPAPPATGRLPLRRKRVVFEVANPNAEEKLIQECVSLAEQKAIEAFVDRCAALVTRECRVCGKTVERHKGPGRPRETCRGACSVEWVRRRLGVKRPASVKELVQQVVVVPTPASDAEPLVRLVPKEAPEEEGPKTEVDLRIEREVAKLQEGFGKLSDAEHQKILDRIDALMALKERQQKMACLRERVVGMVRELSERKGGPQKAKLSYEERLRRMRMDPSFRNRVLAEEGGLCPIPIVEVASEEAEPRQRILTSESYGAAD